MLHQKSSVEEYSKLAEEYDRRWAFYIQRTIKETAGRMRLSPEDTVLDVGCGTGAMLCQLAQTIPAKQLVGLDPVREMLEVARRKLPADAALCLGWAECLPFADAQFDAVVSCNMFHNVREPGKSLQEMARVLKPGGQLVITDWCDDFWACKFCGWYLRATRRPHFKIYRQRECERLLAENGYAVQSSARYKINWLWGLMTATARKQ